MLKFQDKLTMPRNAIQYNKLYISTDYYCSVLLKEIEINSYIKSI